MNIIAVDDERIMLSGLLQCIRQASPDSDIQGFRMSLEALKYAQENPVDVAFVDIRMPGMDGLELGRRLLEIHPDLNLIFCTAYDEYISEAFRKIRCNGYIVKPADTEQIAEELRHLRIQKSSVPQKRVRIQCFGWFEIFADDRPIEFEYTKTKELLAYLVDKCGGTSGNQEIIAALWDDDDNHNSYFKKLRKDLQDTLEKYECSDILWRQRGGLGINTDTVDCDYYTWRQNNTGKYDGDYMLQYDWANIPLYEW